MRWSASRNASRDSVKIHRNLKIICPDGKCRFPSVSAYSIIMLSYYKEGPYEEKRWISAVIFSLLLAVSLPLPVLNAREISPASVKVETLAKKSLSGSVKSVPPDKGMVDQRLFWRHGPEVFPDKNEGL